MLAFHDGPPSEHRVITPASGTSFAGAAPSETARLGRALSDAAATLRRHDPTLGIATLLPGPADLALRGGAAPACDDADVDAFLDAVRAYVRALRAAGAAPEQVVIGVKRQMHAALGAGADPRRVNAWLAHAVTWGIEEYYRD